MLPNGHRALPAGCATRRIPVDRHHDVHDAAREDGDQAGGRGDARRAQIEPLDRLSAVAATLQAFSEWVRGFGDEQLTTALLDRPGAHHAHILSTRGPLRPARATEQQARQRGPAPPCLHVGPIRPGKREREGPVAVVVIRSVAPSVRFHPRQEVSDRLRARLAEGERAQLDAPRLDLVTLVWPGRAPCDVCRIDERTTAAGFDLKRSRRVAKGERFSGCPRSHVVPW